MAQTTVPLRTIGLVRGERSLLLGGTRSGKSTLAEYLIREFLRKYPKARILVVDSKPRFRAEFNLDGTPAARRYKRWSHGPVLSGSMRLPEMCDPKAALDAAWKLTHVVVAQTDDERMRGWQAQVVRAFFRESRASIPYLVYVDETLDFYSMNGSPVGGTDSIRQCARSGGEKGLALLCGSQRPRGIPVQLLSEVSTVYLFHLDFIDDMKYLGEMGYPWKAFPAPVRDHVFWYWSKSRRKTPVQTILNEPRGGFV